MHSDLAENGKTPPTLGGHFDRLRRSYASIRKSFHSEQKSKKTGSEQANQPHNVYQSRVSRRLSNASRWLSRKQTAASASVSDTTSNLNTNSNSKPCPSGEDDQVAIYRDSYRAFKDDDCDEYDRRQPSRYSSPTRPPVRPKSDASMEIERRLRRSKGRKLASARYCAPNSEFACDGLDLEQLEAIKRDNLTGHQSVTASAGGASGGDIIVGNYSATIAALTGHQSTICTCQLAESRADRHKRHQVERQQVQQPPDVKPEDLAASCCCHSLHSVSSDSDQSKLPEFGYSDSDSDSDSDLKSHSDTNSVDLNGRESKRGSLINSSCISRSGNLHSSHDTDEPRTQPSDDGQADENECGQLRLRRANSAQVWSKQQQPALELESKKANSLAMQVAESTPSSPTTAQTYNRRQQQQQEQQHSRDLITESPPVRMQMQPQEQKRLASSRLAATATADSPQGGVLSVVAVPGPDAGSSSQQANEGATVTTTDQCCEQQPSDPLTAKLVCSPSHGHKLGSLVNFQKAIPKMQQPSNCDPASDEHLYASIYGSANCATRARDTSADKNAMRQAVAPSKNLKDIDTTWSLAHEYQPQVYKANYDHMWDRQDTNYDEDDEIYGYASPADQYQADDCCSSQQFEKRKTSFLGRLKQMLIGSTSNSSNQKQIKGHHELGTSRSNLNKWHRNGFSSVTLSSKTGSQALKRSQRNSSSRKSVNLVGQNLSDDEAWKARSSRLFSGFLTIGRRYTLSSQNNPSKSIGDDRESDITPPMSLSKARQQQSTTNLRELFMARQDSYGSARSVDSNSSSPISADSGLSCNNLQHMQNSSCDDQYVSTSASSMQADPSRAAGGANYSRYESMQCNFKVVGRARAKVYCNPCAYDKEALVFNQGDLIDILERNESGTWIGRCGGRIGHFKFINITEVEMMNSDETTTTTTTTTPSAVDGSDNYANATEANEIKDDNDNDEDNAEANRPIPSLREGFITKLQIKSKHLQPSSEQAKSASLYKKSKSMNNIVAAQEACQSEQEAPVDPSSSLEQLLFAIGLAGNLDSNSAPYVEIFNEAGINSLDVFSSIQDSAELKELGIVDQEHQLRLLMAAKIIKQASQAARQDFLMAYESSRASHHVDKREEFSLIHKAKFNQIDLVPEEVGSGRHSRKQFHASQSNLLIDDGSDTARQPIHVNIRQPPVENRPRRLVHQHQRVAKTAINPYYRNDLEFDSHIPVQYSTSMMMTAGQHHHHTDRGYSMRLAQQQHQHHEFRRMERRNPRSDHWPISRQGASRHQQQFPDRITHHDDDLSKNEIFQARGGQWIPSRCFQDEIHSHQEAMHMARVRQANGCGYIATTPSPSLGEHHYSHQQPYNRLISQPKVLRASRRLVEAPRKDYPHGPDMPRYNSRSQINNNSKSAYDLRLDLSHFFN